MTDVSQLLRKALALPFEDRVRLAHELWASIHSDEAHADDVLAVADEATRRSAELDRGAVQPIAHDEVMSIARESLRRDAHRSRDHSQER
jgi:putative addiction module component (TIGR02574 family)